MDIPLLQLRVADNGPFRRAELQEIYFSANREQFRSANRWTPMRYFWR